MPSSQIKNDSVSDFGKMPYNVSNYTICQLTVTGTKHPP